MGSVRRPTVRYCGKEACVALYSKHVHILHVVVPYKIHDKWNLCTMLTYQPRVPLLPLRPRSPEPHPHLATGGEEETDNATVANYTVCLMSIILKGMQKRRIAAFSSAFSLPCFASILVLCSSASSRAVFAFT